MKLLIEYRKEVREAVWLWWQLNSHAVSSAEKWWSVDGGAYSDEGIATGLDVTAATARRWRLKLERAGLIRTFLVTPLKRRFEVLNLGFTNGTIAAASAPRVEAVN